MDEDNRKQNNKVWIKKQIRLKRDQGVVLSKVLRDQGLTFQQFAEAVVEAYLRGDPNMILVLKDYNDLSTVSKNLLDEYLISKNERDKLLEEFEKKGDI